tara:strand:+ start:950 stop:2587 length:1638 start_codon:yes stop_codon:yes gene_type:complete
MAEERIIDRWRLLDGHRTMGLERARKCAALTIPSLLPYEGFTSEDQLPQPYSSVSARGVTNMASKILSAMLPLNDAPFFKFELSTGIEPDLESINFLESLSYQVYNKLSSKNLRETIYAVLQHLIVVGDVLLIQEDDFNFRVIRLDQFVVRRDVEGSVLEIIYLEFVPKENDVEIMEGYYNTSTQAKKGFDTLYVRLEKQDDGTWNQRTESEDGEEISSGTFTVLPVVALRWSSVSGENYGRSHCEDIIGDIQTLESFTEALLEGTAAGSAFWIGIDPAGLTELDDVAGSENGSFISARQQDVFTLSPSATMNPQIQSTQNGVENMRREVGNAFLLSGSAIPSGDRVTATAVRMIGNELETVLGGAFSAISRDLMEPIVKRTVYLMLQNEEIDPELEEQFSENGLLTVEIVTGLQALSRDTDLNKLLQMGEMVKNLPAPALKLFKWEEYAKALVTSIGFDSNNWVKSPEEAKQEEMAMMQEQQAIQQQAATQGNIANQLSSGVAGSVGAMASQDLQETGGQGIQQVLAENPELAEQVSQMSGGII